MKVKHLYILFLLITISCNSSDIDKNVQENETEAFYLLDIDADVISGEYALAPSKANYDTALVYGIEGSIFVFYPRKVIEKRKDSVVLYQIGDTVMLPNSLIIPIKPNQKATKGDVVLTWWQSGTGMQRAIVLNNDTSATPTVYYLDNQYSFYSSVTDINFWIDTLKPNSFILLKDEIMSGRSILVKKDYFSVFYTIINATNDKLLALSWAGLLEVFEKDDFTIIPLRQNFNVGDSVLVPYFGTFSKGIVKAVWPDIGKITAEILFIDENIDIYANMIDSYITHKND
ncbi:MAG: hypothetical protein JXR68_00465 [Bacteroidales bacterium]|nr:hypothetical protein [Bacteroidales bacterium]